MKAPSIHSFSVAAAATMILFVLLTGTRGELTEAMRLKPVCEFASNRTSNNRHQKCQGLTALMQTDLGDTSRSIEDWDELEQESLNEWHRWTQHGAYATDLPGLY